MYKYICTLILALIYWAQTSPFVWDNGIFFGQQVIWNIANIVLWNLSKQIEIFYKKNTKNITGTNFNMTGTPERLDEWTARVKRI